MDKKFRDRVEEYERDLEAGKAEILTPEESRKAISELVALQKRLEEARHQPK